ncbi:MAG: hypothetical protein KDD69_15720 [Bdellovibrionales bacterium]|nr:hypothetical protein [Bdellovibrionales bacterium]
MNSKRVRLFLLATTALLSLCGSASIVHASEPGTVVTTALERLRSSGSFASLVELIDWEGRYQALSEEEKIGMGLRDAEGLRSHYSRIAEANGALTIERLKSEATEAGAAERMRLTETIQTLEAELERQRDEFRTALAETQFRVGSATVGSATAESEQTAVVNLERSTGVAIESIAVRLHRRGDTWLLESAAPLNPLPSSYEGTPFGRLPEPTAVLGQP